MSFKNFSEYLNQKGKLQTEPIVDGKADTAPTAPPRPPKAVNKGKNWKDYKATESAQLEDGGNGTEPAKYTSPGTQMPPPYKGPGTDPGQPKYEKGLVYQGDQELVYNPKTDDQHLKTNLNKTKTESFIETTREMTPKQYADFVLKNKNATSVSKIAEVVDAIKDNKDLVETLVRELKRKGAFANLMSTVLDQPEAYTELAMVLANENTGKEVSRRIAKAVNDVTPETTLDESTTILRPEHHLIEALGSYNSIKTSMCKKCKNI